MDELSFKKNYVLRKACSLCLSEKLDVLVDFGQTPIANQLNIVYDSVNHQEKFPLILGMCNECKHIQLLSIVEPKILFHDYPYLSSINQSSLDRMLDLASNLITRYDLNEESFVLEIGSNDGTFLNEFSKHKIKVLGIDPADNPTKIAKESGLNIIQEYFSNSVAEDIIQVFPVPNLIIANNVLAHTIELNDIFLGISKLMNNNTILIIEFSYVLDIYNNLLFDTIYHEHMSYHSLLPLIKFLNKFDMSVLDIERFSAHGGSARLYIGRSNSNQNIANSVDDALKLEEKSGIHEKKAWLLFQKRVMGLKNSLHLELEKLVKENKNIIGYGVPAKFTTLFHVLELDKNLISNVVDDNSLKIGRFAPGTNYQIMSSNVIKELKPHYILIFSWNYSLEIIESFKTNKLNIEGVIVPLPSLKIMKI